MRAIILLLIGAVAWAGPANLLDNGGFEEGLTSWAAAPPGAFGADAKVAHSGAASLHLQVDGGVAGIDSAPLSFGQDVDAETVYEVSAWIRCGGIVKGDFGGRIYFYGADGKPIQMLTFGGLRDGAPAGDWYRASIRIGPGTPNPVPPEATTMRVRFSIWSPNENCTGTAWVDDVRLEGQLSTTAGPPEWLKRGATGTAVVLAEALDAGSGDAGAAELAALLEGLGLAANMLSAEQLATPGLLDPRWVDLVVLPHAPVFPADARDPFVRYATHGGSFLAFGGLPFERFVRKVGGEWIDVTETTTDPARGHLITDFANRPPAWDLGHAGEGAAATVDTEGAGAEACARLRLNVRAFAYGGLKNARAPEQDQWALVFRARGDGNTNLLTVEPREEDGSRWKRVIELGTDWREYTIPAAQFLAYASKDRGGPGDYFKPDKAAGIWFGLTAPMCGPGEHTVWLDDVRWARMMRDAGEAPAPIRPRERADYEQRFFGADLRLRAEAKGTVPVCTPAQPFEGASLRAVLPGSSLGGDLPGTFSGHLASAPESTPVTETNKLTIGGPRAGRTITLIEARKGDEVLGPAASAYLPLSKQAQGGVWACFGAAAGYPQLLAAGGRDVRERVACAVRLACGQPAITSCEMRFQVAEGTAVPQVQVSLRGRPGGDPCTVSVRVSTDGKLLYGRTAPALPGGSVSVAFPELDAARLEYQVDCALLAGQEIVDSYTLSVDARKCLMSLCDWLVANQRPDGTYSGISFEDQRAIRGLLGAYETTRDERYRASALRWGDEMLRLQREDGGYRMGYGIGVRGEECYVADGGEIAIGMARLTSYTEGAQRERYVESLRGYFRYREDFREPNGAIGVGWCLSDYSKRPVTPLQTPTRIYAGELNTYTIGCTLAAAAAYARITGAPEDLAMARRDLDWLLAHYKGLSGAAVESAFWAYELIATEEQKARIVEHMRESFRKRIVNPADHSWLGGGGRSVLDLDGIAWWLHRIDREDAQMRAAFGRWVYALCGSNSTSAAGLLMQQQERRGDEDRFLDFLAVALADAVQPMVSLKQF